MIDAEFLTKIQEQFIIDWINYKIDSVIILVMVVNMMMMQVGLLMSEVGCARTKNGRSIIYRFLMNMMIVGVVYFILGHEFANGSESGLLGSTSFDLIELDFKDYDYKRFVVGFIFCQTTNAIACSSYCERTFLDTYVFFSIIMSSIIYPVLAYWVWGGGWLHQMGYHDHGGSGVIHMTAGCAALIGNYILGPRLSYFKVKTPEKKSFASTRNQLYKSQQNDIKLQKQLKQAQHEIMELQNSKLEKGLNS